MASLYKLEGDMIALRNQLETEHEFEGDDAELKIVEDQLQIKQGELSKKVEGYLHVISQVKAQSQMALNEIKRIQEFAEHKQHVADRLEGALLQALLLFGEEDSKGIKRMEIGTHRLSTRRSNSINILDESIVTDDCKYFDVTFKNLTPEIKNFLAKRIQDLPESVGKSALIAAFEPKVKVSKTLIKEKLGKEEIDWAENETKYSLTIK